MFRSHWQLLLVRQERWLLELGQIDLGLLRLLYNDLVTHKRVLGTLSVIIPSPDVGATTSCARNRVRLANCELHDRSVVHHVILEDRHVLRAPRLRMHVRQVGDDMLVYDSTEEEYLLG